MNGGDTLLSQALLLGIALTRTAAAFALTPLFSGQTIPAMVRNSIFVAFGVIVLALQPQAGVLHPTPMGWLALFGRESFVGLLIGFFFGGVLWSFEAAGQIIDAKIGPASLGLTDPFSGEPVSLNAALIGRLAVLVFMMAGGLTLMVHTLLESYIVWPIAASAPRLEMLGAGLVERQFADIVGLAVSIAAPALIMLTALEGAMGLINRFVPQLNVFAVSLAVKSWLAIFIVLALLDLEVNAVIDQVSAKASVLESALGVFWAR